MPKKRVVYNIPAVNKGFKNLDEVTDYLRRFANSMSITRPNLFQGDVFVESRAPTDADGKDGDMWVENSDT